MDLSGFTHRFSKAMLKRASECGLLEGELLSSPDIDGRWESLAPDFCADAIPQFNSYPEAVFAWAAYLGMAVATGWDRDWDVAKTLRYEDYRGPRGFDYMDEHIQEHFLGMEPTDARPGMPENGFSKTLHSLADQAHDLLRHENIEPGTADAYRAVIASLSVMYRLGAAIRLKTLGYVIGRI